MWPSWMPPRPSMLSGMGGCYPVCIDSESMEISGTYCQACIRTSQVKHNSLISNAFEELQGVPGIPSTEIFKARGHQSLVDLERSGQGFRIGQTDVSAPTCADDITLIADTTIGLQRMLKIAEIDALQERYNYNQTKSTVMIFGKTPAQKYMVSKPSLATKRTAPEC